MLNITQLISFEISTKCNLSHRHRNLCPIGKRPVGEKPLTDEIIIQTAVDAYGAGFTGMVTFHFYNEPMLHYFRMFYLMDSIRERVPQSRFLLWTNGTILIHNPHLAMFEKTFVSNYFKTPAATLAQFFSGLMINDGGEESLDDRLLNKRKPIDFAPCGLSVGDFIINNSGDVHLCCADWMNEIKIGNIFDTGIEELAQRKWEIVKTVWKEMSDQSPNRCLTCCNRSKIADYDETIYQKAKYLQEQGNA